MHRAVEKSRNNEKKSDKNLVLPKNSLPVVNIETGEEEK